MTEDTAPPAASVEAAEAVAPAVPAKPAKPPKRRTYGSGSVYKDGTGRWRGAVYTTDPATGVRSRQIITGPTSTATRAKLVQIAAVGNPATSMKVGDWLTRWLPTTQLWIKASTYRGYQVVARSLGRSIGEIPLGKLSATDVEQMMAAMVQSGRSPRTAIMARKVLGLAIGEAIRQKLVNQNVAAQARPPRVERYEARALTAAEARILITTTADDELGPLWAVLISTGMRQGEALGLSWPDIDFAGNRLSVRRSLARGYDGKLALGAPKSERSRRTIALPAVARAALERQLERQTVARSAVGKAWQGKDELVFLDGAGRPWAARTITPALRVALERAGLPAVRCHDLRHSAASIALAGGSPLIVVSRMLGHATVAVTADVYSHIVPELQTAVADVMDRALEGGAE